MNQKYERQLKKGVLDILVLELLSEREMYGYQIIQTLQQKNRERFSLKEGTLYPILYRLEDDGWIESRWSEPEGKTVPKKYYAITELGENQLKELKDLWFNFQKKFLRYYEVMGMNEKEYVKKVLKRIPLQKNDKTRLEEDLLQDIQSAMEDGESWENIQKRMGTPEQVALEYCTQIGCSMKKRGKWPWILLGVIIVVVVGIWILIPKNYPLQSSKYFDEKEVETWNKAVVENISNKNIDKILSNSSEAFQNEVSEGELLTYFEDMDTGNFVRISQIESVENRSLLQGTFAVSEVTVQYENRSVIYLISFDTDGKLAGLYMR